MTRKNRHLLPHARAMRREPTRAENRLWQLLRGQKLGWKFRRQVPIGPFIVDFYCAELNLIIELDGSAHQWTQEYDDARTTDLYVMGYRVFRVRNEETKDPQMLEQIIHWIVQQCAPPPHPPSAPSPPTSGGEGRS